MKETNMCCDVSGLVFDIQRFSLNDGPGIRTTIFLKGCPLHCAWCHNPESQFFKPEIMLDTSKCIGCGACFRTCENHMLVNGVHTVCRDRCIACGRCADACPACAIEIAGKRMEVDEVLHSAMKDRCFWGKNGGITITGGEPLAQPDFTYALLRASREKGVHTAIETSGFADEDTFSRIASHTDLVLFDIKETNDAKHLEYVGCARARILENLRYLNTEGIPVRLRCPLIPGYNARDEHLDAIARLANELDCVERVELAPYHPLGRSKANKLNREYLPGDMKSPDALTTHGWLTYLGARTNKPVVLA